MINLQLDFHRIVRLKETVARMFSRIRNGNVIQLNECFCYSDPQIACWWSLKFSSQMSSFLIWTGSLPLSLCIVEYLAEDTRWYRNKTV